MACNINLGDLEAKRYENKVMIIDDNPIDQLITEYILKLNHKAGNIIVMTSVHEALSYITSNSDNPGALPSLIFLDLDMPVMNGFDFLNHFNQYTEEIKSKCKIIVVTGSEIISDIERVKSNPHVVKLISKPLHRYSLVL